MMRPAPNVGLVDPSRCWTTLDKMLMDFSLMEISPIFSLVDVVATEIVAGGDLLPPSCHSLAMVLNAWRIDGIIG